MDAIEVPRLLAFMRRLSFPHKLGICEQIWGQKLSKHGVCWIETSTGLSWKLDLSNPVHRWIVYGDYEGPDFLGWAKSFISKDSVLVDSGANIGQVTLYFAQWIDDSDGGRILAFEPGVEAFKWLEECVSANNLAVDIVHAALGEEPAVSYLCNSSPEFQHGGQSYITKAAEGEKIEILRLDEELAKREIKKVDLWKLDVEGYELKALKGAENYLREQNIKAIYVELSGDNPQAVRDYLAQFAYEPHLIAANKNPYRISDIPKGKNILFL